MSDLNHTPGPWELGVNYFPENGSPGSCELSQVGEMATLATICIPQPNRSGHHEGLANAKLIKSSPELLESLQLALEALAVSHAAFALSFMQDSKFDNARKLVSRSMESAIATIASATT